MPRLLTLLLAAILGWLASFSLAAAQDSTTGGTVVFSPGSTSFTPITIALTNLAGAGGEEAELGRQIREVMANNLGQSGLFTVTDPSRHPQAPEQLQGLPDFAAWAATDTAYFVSGRVVLQPGALRVEFRLWDATGGSQLIGNAYNATPDRWRQIAHVISDAIYKQLIGDDGYFNTRIAFIAESGPATRRRKQLAVMDQDGASPRFLTDGATAVVTPRFSPDGSALAVMYVTDDQPRVGIVNLASGRSERLGQFRGMTLSPRFSPDGRQVVLSQIEEGNPDIYIIDLASRQARRLTDSPAIDTAPSFSPDGRQIVFESNRGGSQQIYVMSAQGGGATRISFGDGVFGTPVWSPNGRLIAYTRQHRGQFAIGVMAPDGSNARDLDVAFHAEGPVWAPNGRVLAYFKETPVGGGQSRQPRLYAIDAVTGLGKRLLPTPGDASDPAWSPPLP